MKERLENSVFQIELGHTFFFNVVFKKNPILDKGGMKEYNDDLLDAWHLERRTCNAFSKIFVSCTAVVHIFTSSSSFEGES